ncbi:hypothetical protein C8F01DRAFT_1260216 [Mycena amicta]|nr:hypothetical protein C8F01DRAFT_1263281 [Mycena amicta]KAJ7053998.1 hypothetical protein C8F01DRAFT_1260216 [Mycena amicta]
MPLPHPAFLTRFFSSPPTRDDAIRLQDLQRDPQLPYGRIRSIVDSLNERHCQIMLLGRVVGVVEQSDERYIILEGVPGALLDDFKELVWALERLQGRTSEHVKSADSWTRSPGDGWHSGLIYTTHAWEREEPWLITPTLLEPAMSDTKVIDPIEFGAVVFCVANLLRIDRTVRGETPKVLAAQWVVKCRFLSRLHSPMEGAEGQNTDMAFFLNRGALPGGRRLDASEELPVREDADLP